MEHDETLRGLVSNAGPPEYEAIMLNTTARHVELD